jgi:hypothetical protein
VAASLPVFATPEIIVRFAQSGTAAHGLHLDCKTALGLCPESQIALSAERIPGSLLAPLSAAGSPDKSGGTVAVVAGLIAAVKLACVESIELQKPKSAGRFCHLRLDYACTHGDRGKQSKMNWQQAKAQARSHSSSLSYASRSERISFSNERRTAFSAGFAASC